MPETLIETREKKNPSHTFFINNQLNKLETELNARVELRKRLLDTVSAIRRLDEFSQFRVIDPNLDISTGVPPVMSDLIRQRLSVFNNVFNVNIVGNKSEEKLFSRIYTGFFQGEQPPFVEIADLAKVGEPVTYTEILPTTNFNTILEASHTNPNLKVNLLQRQAHKVLSDKAIQANWDGIKYSSSLPTNLLECAEHPTWNPVTEYLQYAGAESLAVSVIKILQETTIESYPSRPGTQNFFEQLQELARQGKDLYIKQTGASGLTTFNLPYSEVNSWQSIEDMVDSFFHRLNKIDAEGFILTKFDIEAKLEYENWAIQTAVEPTINPLTGEITKEEASMNAMGSKFFVTTKQNINNDIHNGNLGFISKDSVAKMLKGTIHEGLEVEFALASLADLYGQLKLISGEELTPQLFDKILKDTGPWGKDFIQSVDSNGQAVWKCLETNFRITGTTYPVAALIKQYGLERIVKMLIKGEEIVFESQNFDFNPNLAHTFTDTQFAARIGQLLETSSYKGVKLSKLMNIFAICPVEGAVKITAVASALNYPELNNKTEIGKIAQCFKDLLVNFEPRTLI